MWQPCVFIRHQIPGVAVIYEKGAKNNHSGNKYVFQRKGLKSHRGCCRHMSPRVRRVRPPRRRRQTGLGCGGDGARREAQGRDGWTREVLACGPATATPVHTPCCRGPGSHWQICCCVEGADSVPPAPGGDRNISHSFLFAGSAAWEGHRRVGQPITRPLSFAEPRPPSRTEEAILGLVGTSASLT